jgi:hypothetical protein
MCDKLYSVTSTYFDGDHDHGSYRIGPFTDLPKAEQAAEILANHRYEDKWKWIREEDKLPRIEATEAGWGFMSGNDSIYINLEPVNPTVNPDNVKGFLHITYT